MCREDEEEEEKEDTIGQWTRWLEVLRIVIFVGAVVGVSAWSLAGVVALVLVMSPAEPSRKTPRIARGKRSIAWPAAADLLLLPKTPVRRKLNE